MKVRQLLRPQRGSSGPAGALRFRGEQLLRRQQRGQRLALRRRLLGRVKLAGAEQIAHARILRAELQRLLLMLRHARSEPHAAQQVAVDLHAVKRAEQRVALGVPLVQLHGAFRVPPGRRPWPRRRRACSWREAGRLRSCSMR